MTLQIILLTIATYFIASIPMSMVVGYLVTGEDIRNYGDGNPGATNVKRATGGIQWYVVALVLDGFKGLFPVGIPHNLLGWSGWAVTPVAIAAVLGHAFMIYLRFGGGKAIAITGGIWTGLLVWEGLAVMVISLLIGYALFKTDDWSITFMMVLILVYMLIFHQSEPYVYAVWAGNAAVVVYKHRQGLMQRPEFRNWSKRDADEA